MKDPIERQAAIDEIQRFLGYIDQDMIDRIKIGLRKLPTIEPVKHGRWIGKPIAGYSTVRCSVCKETFTENTGRWNYCPNCGAKMPAEEREIHD